MNSFYTNIFIAVSVTIVFQLLPSEAGEIGIEVKNKNDSHNYYFGNRTYVDRTLYHDYLNLKSKFMQVTSVDLGYPANGSTPLGTIRYIEVLDQRLDGTGGYVYIKNGGVGNNFVTLHLKTQRNHGMEFLINIWGH